jgi:hypothetical protein
MECLRITEVRSLKWLNVKSVIRCLVMSNLESLKNNNKKVNEFNVEHLSDEELVKYYNEASDLENQCFKMLFDVKMKKNKFLGEMIRRSKLNAEN